MLNLEKIFLRNPAEFKFWKKKLNSVLNVNAELPSQVFKKGYNQYRWVDSDFLIHDVGWEELRELARLTNDLFVIVGVLDPDPETYYYKEFGYYNWIKIPCNLSGDQYLDILNLYPIDSPADSMCDNSSKIVWFPPSMEWVIFSDRDYEVGILAKKSDSELERRFVFSSAWNILNDDM
ncbi:hypothetical protein [Bacillus wiedmannii]|uniref:hypothetical protein n=1 Tax=Bacillus wiedmannii TaxID=1890302 RepID=UPI000BEFE5FB|nr:hypothetical protein [Bacillus wiedmannii]MCU5706192.1 hypothetical protein [Bacillus wiedmannii]PEJ70282.1 hypothetical protein CN888_23010 [Bacillus wiedmannii]PHA28507.1 hypothetical protein COE69_27945 [Bacillus wiedmannii]